MTNSGPVTLGAGGGYVASVEDATAGPGYGWSFLQANSSINVQSTSGNPFTVTVQTPEGPATSFTYGTNYDWVMATASGGIVNFTPTEFTVNDSQFANDLAGGYFYVRALGNSLVLSFTNNHPPVAGVAWLYRTGTTMAIPISMLTHQWSDPDGDPVVFAGVDSSTNGAAVGNDNNFIYYTNANNVADEILYMVDDIRTSPPAVYRPGDTQQTGTGEIMLLPPPNIRSATLNSGNLSISGSGGISSGVFYLLCSPNLTLPIAQWTCISTNVFDSSGNFNLAIPTDPTQSELFYVLKLQ